MSLPTSSYEIQVSSQGEDEDKTTWSKVLRQGQVKVFLGHAPVNLYSSVRSVQFVVCAGLPWSLQQTSNAVAQSNPESNLSKTPEILKATLVQMKRREFERECEIVRPDIEELLTTIRELH